MSKVLITGCSSGFGYFTALEALRAGYEVVATFRNLRDGEKLLRETLGMEGKVRVEELDVLSRESVVALVNRTGPVDCLVNNAGICISGSFYDTAEHELDLMMATNFLGPLRLINAFVPGMLEIGEGRIINLSSVAGAVGLPGLSCYAASKHALEGYSESIYWELKEKNIKLSLVECGLFRTGMLGTNRRETKRASAQDSPFSASYVSYRKFAERILFKRAGDPMRVARSIIRILQARHPNLRYRIGWDAHILWVLNHVCLMSLVIPSCKMLAKDDSIS
jgi:NAD(P)-dependent dehydrogenase (short-subunit alcohol dehydrogenase family)